MSRAVRSEAADYHRRGWAPIPVKGRSKEPNLVELAPYLGRRATEEELSSWTWPGVGIVTGPLSGVLVLDVDGPEGEAVLKEHGHPITPMVRTGSGGLHLYFRHPDADVRTGIRVAPGLDVKAVGGYVVAPPSVGPSGTSYEWIISPEDAEPAHVPEWLMRFIERPRRNGTAGPVGVKIPSGQRNKELTSLGGSMRRRGMGGEEIFAALAAVNRTRCEPPLEEEEVRKIAASVSRYEPADKGPPPRTNGHGDNDHPARFNLTDLGNADRFIARYGGRVLWCEGMRAYLVWDGKRWAKDDGGGAVVKLAQEVARGIHREAADETDTDAQRRVSRWAVQSQNAARISAMLAMARPHLTASINALDSDPWLLNCQNGTLDLRTGELRPHDPKDLITKIVPVAYEPDAEAPRFAAFLREVLVDAGVIGFVQRFAGYSLTGDTRERAMTILWGSGKNGKSTLVELLLALLGDYADSTDVETVLTKKHSGVGNDVAALRGHRFVSCSEVEKGRRLAESKVKQLTGRDTITARFLFCEPFSFRPEFKLWMSTNNKPEIVGVDDAIWDRIRLVPFTQRFNGKAEDPTLPAKLRAELPGVLVWAVRGCLEWQRSGLDEPDAVRAATAEYREEMDTLAAFVSERCVEHPQASVQATRLYEAYKAWCSTTGEEAEKQKRFGQRLTERGHDRKKSSVYYWFGIGLVYDGPDDSGGENRDEQSSTSSSDTWQAGAENGSNGPNAPDLWDDGPSDKNGAFAAETRSDAEELGRFGPFSTSMGSKNTREAENPENGPNGPKGPEGPNPEPEVHPKPERLTEEQALKVQRRIREGMDPKKARREVLGVGP